MSPRILRIADAFNKAGLQTIVSDNIMGTIWDKLFINVATGALSGITRLPYGHLYQVPALEACAVAAVAEAMAVAKARGVRTSITEPVQAWRKAGAGLPFEFKRWSAARALRWTTSTVLSCNWVCSTACPPPLTLHCLPASKALNNCSPHLNST
jgi:ketopantoate reductase